ncbi:MAG: right-handed parallel beta-helix repeat-containing protein, partial [Planctomycetota bacterium]
MEKRKRLTSMVFLAGLLALSVVTHAGSLEPSAPPGPTMKTLDEVEPRVPIRASDLPLTITEPNSYYLVEDVGFVSTATAITIECNDVTIDLMGYTLKGPDSGTGSGIYMNGRSNVEVCNGTVRDFYRGIREQSSSGEQHRVINVRVMSNEYGGIFLMGYGHLVKDCTAQENGYYGIYAKYGSTVTGNTCYDNGYDGIYAPYGCTVTGNTAYENGLSGIYAYTGCTVTGNTVSYNTVDGIKVDQDCTVSDN